MGYFQWVNSKIKKMTWPDISCTKLAAMAFALTVAKLWPGLLSLEWYWYAVIAVAASVRPLVTLFSK
ncbi:MAG TPA: hypothetical protein VNE39_06800 [Planctomycetota bacterium]|nr:hypothetical protein [Planctomycetota bacterium]